MPGLRTFQPGVLPIDFSGKQSTRLGFRLRDNPESFYRLKVIRHRQAQNETVVPLAQGDKLLVSLHKSYPGLSHPHHFNRPEPVVLRRSH